MKRVAIFVVVVAIGVGIRFYNRSDADQEVKKEAKEFVAKADFYAADAEYIDELIDKHHSGAFNSAYSMGGRYRPDKLDVGKYLGELFSRMAKECHRDKKMELAKNLDELVEVAKHVDAKGDLVEPKGS